MRCAGVYSSPKNEAKVGSSPGGLDGRPKDDGRGIRHEVHDGVEAPDRFLVGYGLDVAGRLRDWPGGAALPPRPLEAVGSSR